MAVFKSSLPVRHELLGDLVVGLVGSDNTTIVDILTVNSAYGATPNGMPLLGKYEITPTVYDDGDAVPLSVDASGKLQVDAEITIPSVMDVTVLNGAGASAVNIQDGGNTITVDGTVAATQSGTWNIDTVTTLTGITNDVNIADGGNSITVDALDLDIRDLAYTQDTVGIWTNTAKDGTGTDYQPIVDASGRLVVNIGAGAASAANILVDDSAFGIATDSVGVVGYLFDDTATDSVDEGDIGAPRMTADRIALSILDDGTNRLNVLNDGDAYGAGTGGILVLGQNGTTDYQALKVDSAGALYVNTGVVGTMAEAAGTANLVKDTPTTVVTHTPAANEEILGITYGGSGKAQVDVYYGTTSSEVRKHTFYTSASNPNIIYTFPAELALTTADTIYVQVTNLELKASPASDFDGYATISYVTV